MPQRTECLYNNEIIGIETIYTVINGKQINIPEKLNDLREKSRANQLFCTCHCGRNLILVAGDRNLKKQHFRVKKDDSIEKECEAITEGENSINSKIILKCWLDEKLNYSEIKTRVQLNTIAGTQRKYEYTLLVPQNSFAVSYSNERINLSSEKIRLLTQNGTSIGVFFVVDQSNFGNDGQYPECMMKVQGVQGYCAFLSICEHHDYNEARLKIAYSTQDIDGIWTEVIVAEDYLKAFSIENSNVIHDGATLTELTEKSKKEYAESIEKEHTARIERWKKYEEECERRRIEAERRQKEEARRKEEEIKRQEEEQRILNEKKAKEAEERAEKEAAEYKHFLATADFNQQDHQVIDPKGERLIKCKYCGKISTTAKFVKYGGAHQMNFGVCYDCRETHPGDEDEVIPPKPRTGKIPRKCPKCGGQMVEKNGSFGKFRGCCNYPKCKYTESRW